MSGEGPDAYVITLEVRDLRAFERASRHPKVVGKEGEAFVKAILETPVQTGIVGVVRHKDGKCVDGANGEHGRQYFRRSGELALAYHYNQQGQRHSGPNGEAACEAFNGAGFGLLGGRTELHYDNGRKQTRREVAQKAARHIGATGLQIR